MKRIVFSILLFLVCILLQAQSTIPASGGQATGTGGSVTYSIGQVVYTTITGTNGSSAQGVQQPYEISVVTAVEEAKDISLVIHVYPNPTSDLLMLKVENFDIVNMSYWLYGVSGNLIETKKVLTNETQISMGNQISGTYYLKVTSGNKEVKTFKIIKN